MATCKNCFRKYDDRGVRDGLFSSYPNFEFCSSVCAGAKREANEQQRDRESAESQAAEYQQRAFEAQKRAQASQLDELIRLQKEANRIAEEESEARSLGISREELHKRRERDREDARMAAVRETAKLEGITISEYYRREQEHREIRKERLGRYIKNSSYIGYTFLAVSPLLPVSLFVGFPYSTIFVSVLLYIWFEVIKYRNRHSTHCFLNDVDP
jgi:hypothetical protein